MSVKFSWSYLFIVGRWNTHIYLCELEHMSGTIDHAGEIKLLIILVNWA